MIKSLIAKLIRLPIFVYLKLLGVLPARHKRVSDMFIDDFLHNKHTSLRKKIWAYRRGFISDRILRYKLNENNYTQYMSDIEFYKVSSYKNRGFGYWYDDKLTTWYILQPYIEFLPVHYFSIVKNKIRRHDLKSHFDCNSSSIIELLKEENELAFKRSRGSQGRGFYKLSFENERFYINGREISHEDLSELITGLNNYLITEYIHCHKKLKYVYSNTPNSIRVVTVYDEKFGAQVTGAFIRFGTSQTSYVDNASAGGISVGVDISTGQLFSPIIESDRGVLVCENHPDTGVKIEGKIPHWSFIVQKLIEISNYLNVTPYLSYDVISAEESFKIIEVNSHGMRFQVHYPFFANKYQKKLFS